ncbi:MAG TPA: NAD-dependent epimerase/dehydratase family protein, partial [Candidatus Omnitrophica bacterium]|nr:NAD-dependent epimerase/dehydratase family protein [Candidatus Omnitrophota bacterium]
MTNTIYESSDFFCHDLPTHPLPNLGKVLVTGASGYIGGRLVPELLVRGYKVRIMVRGDAHVYQNLWPDVEVVVADALNLDQLKAALCDIDTAYYLIHSLNLGPREFEATDIKAAHNFQIAADKTRLRRIIYLGGLGDIR